MAYENEKNERENKKTINWLLDRVNSINIADEIDDQVLEDIGLKVQKGFDEDDASRAEWLDQIEEYIEIAKQITTEKSFPWEGAANIKIPTLTVASNQFHARAYQDIVQSRDIVKCKVTGYDETGEKADRAERIGKHMTYQLMEEMEEWEDDMDKGLMVLPVVGCFFKKTFYDPHKSRNVSKAVWAQDLVIDYDAPSLERATRKSESFTLYPQEIEERMRAEIYLDIELSYEDKENDEPEEFIEQHTFCDLDEDGYKEPYIITIHKNSGKVVRITPRWDEDSIFYKEDDKLISVGQKRRDVKRQNEMIVQQNMQAAQIAQDAFEETQSYKEPVVIPFVPEPTFGEYTVVKIEAIEYYTLFPFLPNPDGSIYSMGFGHLLASLSEAANTTVNQMLDASTLSNLGGGFMTKGPKRPAGWQRTEVGEYVAVETNGMPLRDAILPFNFRGPSAQSFSLLEFLLANARDITGLKDISTELQANTQATTAMIIQEESNRSYNSLYKRIYRSCKDEYRKLYRLNRKYLPEEVYFNVLDNPVAIKKVDYQHDETDVQPVSDPTQATPTQRILKAQAALDIAARLPTGENLYVLKRRLYEALDVPNIDEFYPPPSNEPDPMQELELERVRAEYDQLLAETGETKSKIILNLANAEAKEVGTQLEVYRTELAKLMGVDISGRTNESGLGGMAGTPGDKSDVQAPPGLSTEPGLLDGGGQFPITEQ